MLKEKVHSKNTYSVITYVIIHFWSLTVVASTAIDPSLLLLCLTSHSALTPHNIHVHSKHTQDFSVHGH